MPLCLFYNESSSRPSYTTEQTGILDVSRLLHHPNYWIRDNSPVLKQKTLIFADWTYFDWCEDKASKIYSFLSSLLKKGFAIYIWESKSLTKLTQDSIISLKNRDKKTILPESIQTLQKKLLAQYKVPIDQIVVLDPLILSWLMDDQKEPRSDTLNLSSLFYTTHTDHQQLVSLIRLMQQAPCPLKALNINLISTFANGLLSTLKKEFPEIRLLETPRTHAEITEDALIHTVKNCIRQVEIPELRLLKITSVNCHNYEVNHVLEDLKAIEELTIECCPRKANSFFLLHDPIPSSFPQLRSLSLPALTMKEINRLLQTSVQLRSLSIIVSDADEELDLTKTSALNALSFRAIAPFDAKQLLPLLLKNSKKLRTLSLSGQISGPIDTEQLQSQMTHFCLEQCHLEMESVQHLIAAMPYLESLIMGAYEGYTPQFKLPPKSLSHLKLLDLSNKSYDTKNQSLVTSETLSILLKAAVNLQELHLERCHCVGEFFDNDDDVLEIATLDIEPNSLKQLRSLYADDSTITSIQVNQLLAAAPHLETLSLMECICINSNITLAPKSLQYLSFVNLDSTDIDSKGLQSILEAATNLKHLEIPGCNRIDGPLSLSPAALPHLVFINLADAAIGASALQNLLSAAPNLKELNLTACPLIDHFLLKPNSLKELLSLDINSSKLNTEQLETLLTAAPNIEHINLSGCKYLSGHLGLAPKTLMNISSLETQSSLITREQLNNLLAASPNIKTLNISNCPKLSDVLIFEPDIKLEHLSIIYIENSITYQMLKNLLNAAPNLKKLIGVTSTEALESPAFKALINSYPHLEIEIVRMPALFQDDNYKTQPQAPRHNTNHYYDPVPPEPFSFKGTNRSKNQQMIIEKLSQYLYLRNKTQEIEAIQIGICAALSYYFCNHSADDFELMIQKILAWDGQLEGLDLELVSDEDEEMSDPNPVQQDSNQRIIPAPKIAKHTHLNDAADSSMIQEPPALSALCLLFEELIDYINIYQKTNTATYQYLGTQLFNYLEQMPLNSALVLSNPWHAIGIRRLGKYAFLFYDPNNPMGAQTVQAPELFSTIQSAIGSLVQVINNKNPLQTPIISDWNEFIKEGGLFIIVRAENGQQLLAQAPRNHDYSADALKGVLLKSLNKNPAWILGISNPQYTAFTLHLLHQFAEKNPTNAYQQLKKSILHLDETSQAHYLHRITELPYVSAQITAEQHHLEEKELEKKYGLFFEPWNIQSTQMNQIRALCQKLCQPNAASRLIKLLSQAQVNTLNLAIEDYCAQMNRAVYYIHSPDDLVCSAPYIERRGKQGILRKGPGGFLHHFLTEHKSPIILVNYSNFRANDLVRLNSLLDKEAFADGTPLPAKTLVIGVMDTSPADCYQGADFYSRFTQIEQNPLSSGAFDEAKHPYPFVEVLLENDNDDDEAAPVINLFNSVNWMNRLMGQWVLNNDQLFFKEGLLNEALQKENCRLELQNAPWDNPDFIHFWQRACLRGFIEHEGMKVTLPKGLKLIKGAAYSWPILAQQFERSSTYIDNAQILNPYELSHFFDHYQYNNEARALRWGDGWIKKAQNSCLSIYLTQELSEDQWAELLSECRTYNVCLKTYCAAGVTLPCGLNEEKPMTSISVAPLWLMHHTEHTKIIHSSDPDTTVAQINAADDWEVIDVSECLPSHLIESLKPEFNEDGTPSFHFTQSDGRIIQVLKSNKKILLTGNCSQELENALASLILQRTQQQAAMVSGKLCIVMNQANTFAYAPIQKHEVSETEKMHCLGAPSEELRSQLSPFLQEPLSRLRARRDFLMAQPERSSDEAWQGMHALERSPFTGCLNLQNAPEEARLFHQGRTDAVRAHLEKQPYVFLSGLSGVGKTTFVRTLLCNPNDSLYEGEKALCDWAQSTKPNTGQHILFLDEATLSLRQWTEFEGLFQTPQSILIQGQLYPLSKKHKVIFAGNPVSYGDDRHLASLFVRHGQALVFNPLPVSVLYEDVIKPIFSGTALEPQAAALSTPFLKVYQLLLEAAKNDVLISPRELQMMALLTLSYCQKHPEANSIEVAEHYTYELAKPLVPESFASTLSSTIKNTPLPEADIRWNDESACAFIMTPSRKPIYQQLEQLLALREYRQNDTRKNAAQYYGGLGGVVIEGEPGLGKSELVLSLLRAQGFIEKRYHAEALSEHSDAVGVKKGFYRMPVSMSCSEKMSLLLKAFDEGAVVVCDEVNAAPMMEQFMNALLTGTTPEGRRPRVPGFMIIGTQNPISLAGRRAASTALSRRLINIELSQYPKDELIMILQAKGLSALQAKVMCSIFIKKCMEARTKGYTPQPTFRDLVQQALVTQKNQESNGHSAAIHNSFFKPRAAKRAAPEEEENEILPHTATG